MFWNFAQGLKFKANFHSKMSLCRHEPGGLTFPPQATSNNPTLRAIFGKHDLLLIIAILHWLEASRLNKVLYALRCYRCRDDVFKMLPPYASLFSDNLGVNECKVLSTLYKLSWYYTKYTQPAAAAASMSDGLRLSGTLAWCGIQSITRVRADYKSMFQLCANNCPV